MSPRYQGTNVTYRNVAILSVCQALSMSGVIMIALVGPLVGQRLAPSPIWATLPLGVLMLGTVIAIVPAIWLMSRIGRRAGFVGASLLAVLAALGAAYAIWVEDFFLFCMAVLLIGVNGAFVQQYRFAAAESVEASKVSRAVAYVLLGAVAAAFVGPELGMRTQSWLSIGDYGGSFVALAILYGATLVMLFWLREVAPRASAQRQVPRPLHRIVNQPRFLVAVLASGVAYGTMNFIMTATPGSMHVLDGYSVANAAGVIQAHSVAMFLPALFIGTLIVRLGVAPIMSLGLVALGGCIWIAATSHTLPAYWSALILLGVGWNFLFVAGTSLLTQCYHPAERFRAQAANDVVVFGIGTLANLLAGVVLVQLGWAMVNLLCIPLLLVMAVGVLVLRRHRPMAVES